jgi:hypothetical protein
MKASSCSRSSLPRSRRRSPNRMASHRVPGAPRCAPWRAGAGSRQCARPRGCRAAPARADTRHPCRPGASQSGQITTWRPCSGLQSALSTALLPPGQVTTTSGASGPSAARSASAHFSPSTTATGCQARRRAPAGRTAGAAWEREPPPVARVRGVVLGVHARQHFLATVGGAEPIHDTEQRAVAGAVLPARFESPRFTCARGGSGASTGTRGSAVHSLRFTGAAVGGAGASSATPRSCARWRAASSWVTPSR